MLCSPPRTLLVHEHAATHGPRSPADRCSRSRDRPEAAVTPVPPRRRSGSARPSLSRGSACSPSASTASWRSCAWSPLRSSAWRRPGGECDRANLCGRSRASRRKDGRGDRAGPKRAARAWLRRGGCQWPPVSPHRPPLFLPRRCRDKPGGGWGSRCRRAAADRRLRDDRPGRERAGLLRRARRRPRPAPRSS